MVEIVDCVKDTTKMRTEKAAAGHVIGDNDRKAREKTL
jgi:hypothetical protein